MNWNISPISPVSNRKSNTKQYSSHPHNESEKFSALLDEMTVGVRPADQRQDGFASQQKPQAQKNQPANQEMDMLRLSLQRVNQHLLALYMK